MLNLFCKGDSSPPDSKKSDGVFSPGGVINKMICKQCGKELSENAKFCDMCGTATDTIQNPTDARQNQASAESANTYQAKTVQPTNGMAIAGFVLSFVFALLGLIFSAIALKQIKETGEGGHGLALAGLVISIVALALGLILSISGACAIATLPLVII